jgi:hypothetical protein
MYASGNLRCTVFVLGIMDYGNPVFVLDLRKEKLTEKEAQMAEEDNELVLYDELPPLYSESPEHGKETST